MISNAMYNQMLESIRCMCNEDSQVEPECVIEFIERYVDTVIEKWEWSRMMVILNNWVAELTYVPFYKVDNLLNAFTTKSDEEHVDTKFEMHEEDYENGVQYLSIFDKAGSRFEIRVWNDILDYEAFLRAKTAKVDDDQLYKIVLCYTTLEKTASSWKEIRER